MVDLDLNPNLKNLLINSIKSKRQLVNLKNSYIENKLINFFLRNGDIRKELNNLYIKKGDLIIKSKKFKEVTKSIRNEIGIVYGSYLTSLNSKKYSILESIDSLDDESILELLKLHKSTRERIDFYGEIYEKIFSWFKPNKICDLASGYNPISIYYINKILGYSPEYLAIDLNPEDMIFLNNFFKKFKINANAKDYDLTQLNFLNDGDLKGVDLVFLFKALDSLEGIKKNISKELILNLKVNRIVVSFPSKSLVSKKNFKIEKRNWFFKFLKDNLFEYETFEVQNELFVLIIKNKKI